MNWKNVYVILPNLRNSPFHTPPHFNDTLIPMSIKKLIPFVSIFALLLARTAAGQDAAPKQEKQNESKEDALAAAVANLKLPGVTINREKLEVSVDAICCLDAGLLEYAICKPDTFEHESLFTTTAKPELIHAALLLCGLKDNPQIHTLPELWWNEALKKKESRLQIEVEWEDNKQKVRHSLSSLMQSRQGEDPREQNKVAAKPKPAEDAWIFCGSFIHKPENGGPNAYAANLSGVIVGIWPDPTAVIQYGVPNENPYGNPEAGLEINEEKMPKLGTAVKLIFICKSPEKKEVVEEKKPTPETAQPAPAPTSPQAETEKK